MAQSPYGIAYGIGAGLNTAQDQFGRRQAQAMQMSLQQLALQKAQDEEAQRQALNTVMSERIAPQMEAPTQEQALQAAVGAAPAMGGGIPLGPGTVAGGPVPTLQQATAARPKKYHTPYEKMAYDLSQRAQRLADRGFGMSSMKLMEEANRVQNLHTETLGRDAASSIIRGGKDAAEKLEALGWPGVKNVGRKGDVFFVEDETGNMTTLDYNDLAALSAGSAKLPDILAKIGSSENRIRSQQFTQEEMTRRARLNAEAAMERAKAKGEFDLAAKRIMAMRPVGGAALGGEKASAWVKNLKFEAERLVAKAASEGSVLSPEAAMEQARQSIPPPGAGSQGRDTLTPAQRVTAITKRLDAGHLTQDDRDSLVAELDDLIRESKAATTKKPKTSGGLGNPVAKDGAGKLVYRKDGKYVYADGTEYQAPKG